MIHGWKSSITAPLAGTRLLRKARTWTSTDDCIEGLVNEKQVGEKTKKLQYTMRKYRDFPIVVTSIVQHDWLKSVSEYNILH